MCQCASPTISANGRTHPSVMSGEFGKGLRHVTLRVEVTLAITRDDLQTRYIGREILCWVDILSYINPRSTNALAPGNTDCSDSPLPIFRLGAQPRLHPVPVIIDTLCKVILVAGEPQYV